MTVSAILPVIDETSSLRKTVEVLLADNQEISEILIIVCRQTTPAAMVVCEDLQREYPGYIEVRFQQRPFLGGAMRDAFDWVTGSHVVMMASDLETDPASVKELIAKAREGYDIVTATRWRSKGGFQGYSSTKRVLNWMFQRWSRLLYHTTLSDLTYGFRIFKVEWVRKIEWEELRHPFLLESLLKPLRLGARVVEIPSTWRVRVEGESHNASLHNFLYFRVAFMTRFRPKRKLLRRVPHD